jgi:hypothetical protein
VEDSPAVVETPEVEIVVEDDKPQKSPDVGRHSTILIRHERHLQILFSCHQT